MYQRCPDCPRTLEVYNRWDSPAGGPYSLACPVHGRMTEWSRSIPVKTTRVDATGTVVESGGREVSVPWGRSSITVQTHEQVLEIKRAERRS